MKKKPWMKTPSTAPDGWTQAQRVKDKMIQQISSNSKGKDKKTYQEQEREHYRDLGYMVR